MTSTIPTNTKNTRKPYKLAVFEVYLIWCSVQGFMGHTKAEEVLKKTGNNGSQFGQLLSIRNQSEFAKVYGVENSTLTNWNKLIAREGLLKNTLEPMRKLTKNVVISLYENIQTHGGANEVRLWLQFVEGWVYQSGHTSAPREPQVAVINYG
jgi:hypothetical protein